MRLITVMLIGFGLTTFEVGLVQSAQAQAPIPSFGVPTQLVPTKRPDNKYDFGVSGTFKNIIPVCKVQFYVRRVAVPGTGVPNAAMLVPIPALPIVDVTSAAPPAPPTYQRGLTKNGQGDGSYTGYVTILNST
jgi:hypothetical protein